jgi:hypothetical protein
MEKLAALINIETNRVENVIVVSDENHIDSFCNENQKCVEVKQNQYPFRYGIFDGTDFIPPEDEFLLSLGLIESKEIIDG